MNSIQKTLLNLFGLRPSDIKRRTNRNPNDFNYIELLRGTMDASTGYAAISQDRIVRYSDYDLMDSYCITADSKVFTLADGWRTIKSLADEGGPFWVLSYSFERKSLVPALASVAIQTFPFGHQKPMVSVQLDSGQEIKCTADHKFLLRDGTWCEAKDLVLGSRLMPGELRLNNFHEGDPTEYWEIRQPSIDSHFVWTRKGSSNNQWDWLHRIVASHEFGPIDNKVIHHRDFDSLNNDPSNLQVLNNSSEHRKVHPMIPSFAGGKHTDETKARIGAASRQRKRKKGWHHTEEVKKLIAETSRGRKHSPETIERMREIKREWWAGQRELNNHRVLSVTPIASREALYDIEVPEYHNFVCNGVVIHNSDIATALDIYAEESSQTDPRNNKVVWVDSKDDKIKKEAESWCRRLRLDDRAYGFARNVAKYGDLFEFLLVNPTGVYNMQFIHPSRVARVETDRLVGFQCNDLARLIMRGSGSGNDDIFMPWDFCYDAETEILTGSGWKSFSDVKDSDVVATRNPATKALEWQKPTHFVNSPYVGEMVRFSSSHVDLLVTPNHRMLVAKDARGNTSKEGFEELIVDAESLIGQTPGSYYKLPMTSDWNGEEIKEVRLTPPTTITAAADGQRGQLRKCIQKEWVLSGDDYCALMGAYLSEGCVEGNRGLSIAQRQESKGYDSFKQLFDRIGSRPTQYDGARFRLNGKVLADFCRQFGYSHEKFIPDDIMNATQRQLQIFWDYYVLGDGWFLGRTTVTGQAAVCISTSSSQMAGQLQEIAQKLGFCTSVMTFPAEVARTINGQTCVVRENYRLTTRFAPLAGFHAEKEFYRGSVHCVTVPNGVIYVRRNGKPAWSGNCHFRIETFDRETIYGRSYIEAVRKIWKELQILETMVAVFRVTKSVERNIFYLDMTDTSPQEAKALIEKTRQHLRKQQFIDPNTGDFRIDVEAVTPQEDIILPFRGGTQTKIEKLNASPDIGAIEDLHYFRSKLRTALGIPKAYFDQDLEGQGGWNSKQALILQDQRFSRKIQRLQRTVRAGLTRIFAIHLTLRGISWKPGDFTIRMAPVNQIYQLLKEEWWLRRGQLAQELLPVAAVAGFDQDKWNQIILPEIFNLRPEAIKALHKVETPSPLLPDPDDDDDDDDKNKKGKVKAGMKGVKIGAKAAAQKPMSAVKSLSPPKMAANMAGFSNFAPSALSDDLMGLEFEALPPETQQKLTEAAGGEALAVAAFEYLKNELIVRSDAETLTEDLYRHKDELKGLATTSTPESLNLGSDDVRDLTLSEADFMEVESRRKKREGR